MVIAAFSLGNSIDHNRLGLRWLRDFFATFRGCLVFLFLFLDRMQQNRSVVPFQRTCVCHLIIFLEALGAAEVDLLWRLGTLTFFLLELFGCLLLLERLR